VHGLGVGGDAATRRSDRFADPADRRELGRAPSARWKRSCRMFPGTRGRLTGQKRPLKAKDVWAIRVRLQLEHRARDLALFNLAIEPRVLRLPVPGLSQYFAALGISPLRFWFDWRPQGDSNPCYRRERAMS
jgi:hypothetical protein